MYLPVKASSPDEKLLNYNGTWHYNYKWKPAHENTIDFRIHYDKSNKIHHKYEKDNIGNKVKISYKKLFLSVGYNERV